MHFKQEIGRSKGGLTTKTHAIVDALGNPLRIKLTAGNVHDINPANAMITDCFSDYFLADRAYDADRLIDLAESQGSKIVTRRKVIGSIKGSTIGIFIKNAIWSNVFLPNSKYTAGFQLVMKNWLKYIRRLF